MNKTENNKLITEFLGNKTTSNNGKDFYIKLPLHQLGNIPNYHSDWNKLIKVVEKIESLNFDVIIFHSTTEITSPDIDFKTIFGNSNVYSKIEAVYNACVEFIKWYNQQKQ